MKILLFGEFSGLHTNLKHGLEELGHSVTLVSNGDGAKQIGGADVFLKGLSRNRIVAALQLRLKCLWHLPQLRGYDVVQYIVPFWLPFPQWLQLLYLKYLKRYNKRVFYNACGDDPFIIINMVTLRYSPFRAAIEVGKYDAFCKRLSPRNVAYSLSAYDLFDGIIASSYTYHHSSSLHSNYIGHVPFPTIPIPDVAPYPSVDGVIKIFFGYTRAAGKGARYILEALERIEVEFGCKIQVDIVTNVPYATYVTLFEDCHIFIDQSSSYEYAMNALLAMVRGKVVLSGCEPEQVMMLGRDCPVINILPDAQDIYEKISLLIAEKDSLSTIGSATYHFAKEVHDPVIIAEEYINKWSQSDCAELK